jgi:hypothetical protein
MEPGLTAGRDQPRQPLAEQDAEAAMEPGLTAGRDSSATKGVLSCGNLGWCEQWQFDIENGVVIYESSSEELPVECMRAGGKGEDTTSALARLDDRRRGRWEYFVWAQEAETGRVACGTQVDDHHTVFSVVDSRFEIGSHEMQLTLRQVANEDRVLNPSTVAFHTGGYCTQPLVIPYVIRGQVATASHYRVTRDS